MSKLCISEGMYMIPISNTETSSKVDWSHKCKFNDYTKKDSIWRVESFVKNEDDIAIIFMRPETYSLDTVPAEFIINKKPKQRREWIRDKELTSVFIDSSGRAKKIYKSISLWEKRTLYLSDIKTVLIPSNPYTCECDDNIKYLGGAFLAIGAANVYNVINSTSARNKRLSIVASVSSLFLGVGLMIPEKVEGYNLKSWTLVRTKNL